MSDSSKATAMVTAMARVELTIEVDVGPWSSDLSFIQLGEIVARDAVAVIERLIAGRAQIANRAPKVRFIIVRSAP
jgi:hypothetical protein